MKLHILSDLHRDLAGKIFLPAVEADVVILAGDSDHGFDCGKTRSVCNPPGKSTPVEARFDPECVIDV